MPRPEKIAVLLTCFNRRETTLAALSALKKQDGVGHAFALEVYLVDDGSTDGTGDAVRAAHPDVHVIEGTGSLYWNGGMRLAFNHALAQPFDHMLWLNDDTVLNSDAIVHLLSTSEKLVSDGHHATIIMGATCDPETGAFTYGGFQKRPGPLLRLVEQRPLENAPRAVTTTAGNCVLVSAAAVQLIGNLEKQFFHAWGDVDYGLRLRKAGGSVWLAPNYVAKCSPNQSAQEWQNGRDLSLRERYRNLNSFRGLYPKDWLLFSRRHGGFFWPISWGIPYLKVIIRHVGFRLGLL